MTHCDHINYCVCCLFQGYFKNAAATKKLLDTDGWIFSGDLGYFDTEGYLFLNGRKKEMFKYGSFQIAPSELERFVESIDGVKNACVVGVADDRYGHLPAAVIIKRVNSTITAEEVYKLVEGKNKNNAIIKHN